MSTKKKARKYKYYYNYIQKLQINKVYRRSIINWEEEVVDSVWDKNPDFLVKNIEINTRIDARITFYFYASAALQIIKVRDRL